MNTSNDGSPAFPSHGSMGEVAQEGMTLRDYFAAKALQGFLSRPGSVDPKQDAALAYTLADAMLAAREAP